MTKTNNSVKKKVKGEITAKIVWILGAVFFAVFAILRFSAIGNAAESTSDCVLEGIVNVIYLVAFITGIIYLFGRKTENTAFISSVIYAAAYAFSFLTSVTDGSSYSAWNLIILILYLLSYVIYAVYLGVFAKGKNSDTVSRCLKTWYLPALLLLIVGLAGNICTEFMQSDGFMWDVFIPDALVSVIMAVPVFMMSLVIKKRNK